MKISILQIHTLLGEWEANETSLLNMTEKAMKDSPDVLLLPEMWNIGFFPRPVINYADKDGERTRHLLSGLAGKYGVNIIGGSTARLETSTGHIYNTCYIFDRQGREIASYDKVHLFSPGGEDKVFAGGHRLCTFTLEGHKCAVAICYDLRFGSFLGSLAEDAEILFLPAAWPALRQEHWQVLTQARAIEYQIFVAAANGAAAPKDKHPLAGRSGIFDPWGKKLAQAGKGEEIISAELDFKLLQEAREKIPVRKDNRHSKIPLL